MEGNTNSKEYWDTRFKGNWQDCGGIEQTEFFGQIICELLPTWLIYESIENEYQICDMGCAVGGAVKVISEKLQCKVQGYDFSIEAIKEARRQYPNYKFQVMDLNNIPKEFKCDISICSNVLEHFKEPWDIVSNLMNATNKYVILLCPYKEELCIDEHLYSFTDNVIPVSMSGYDLIFVNVINAAEKIPTYYSGTQILLVYAKSNLHKDIMLSDLWGV
ncbi:MAG: class I SAM-dependent methyltransferase [Aminipila sp.]